ncbi:hypothetical protein HKX34_09925 [Sulfitobacter sp. KE5]|uniref:hypothetical protein n=1 Tax=Sulfitobacter sp. Ks18 TaxID=2731160 RepID=UPI0023E098B1|nr:hypothetical protein [Sulfitobacter sp. Ks18]MDF3414763.1 hypothetical protein [Sulfitobacter sp. KE5]
MIALLSLALNLFNLWLTRNVRIESERRDKEIREANLMREQFCDNFQRPIYLILDELEMIGERLNSISAAGQISENADIGGLNREFCELHLKLQINLRKVSDSQFANGTQWEAITPHHFDVAADKFNAAYNPNLGDDVKCAALETSAQHIGTLCAKVRKQLEDEILSRLK